MITTRSAQEGLTFIHNGDPEGGELHIVLDPTKIKTEFDTVNYKSYVTITIKYNTIRDFVLGKLASREITKIEQMDGEELAAYFTGDWTTLDKLKER